MQSRLRPQQNCQRLAGLLVICWTRLTLAYPSYQERIPNGNRVPCFPGAEGCRKGDPNLGHPESVCFGLGHRTCAGANFPLNPFGSDFIAGHGWSSELCEKDSDGDGQSNGMELGDPCCQWLPGDSVSAYAAAFVPSHPGVANHSQPSGYEKPDCTLAKYRPAIRAPKLNAFNDGEPQRSLDLVMDPYSLPGDRTTYVDFALNFDDEDHDVYHLVNADAIIDKAEHSHHFVVFGCSEKWASEQNRKPLVSGSFMSNPSCSRLMGIWTPGNPIFNLPVYAGVFVGKGVGVVAFQVNIHYTNERRKQGVVVQDGMRFLYTPKLRSKTLEAAFISNLFRNPAIVIPPRTERAFYTQSCHVMGVGCVDSNPEMLSELMSALKPDMAMALSCPLVKSMKFCEMEGVGAFIAMMCPLACGTCVPDDAYLGIPLALSWFHGHWIGSEMYMELIKADGSTHDLASRPVWHYDDQAPGNLLAKQLYLKTGDIIQVTCVYNSSTRDWHSQMGLETVDEMCVVQAEVVTETSTGLKKSERKKFPPRMEAAIGSASFQCVGKAWSGTLALGESAVGIHKTHPLAKADVMYKAGIASYIDGSPTYSDASQQKMAVEVIEACDADKSGRLEERESGCLKKNYRLANFTIGEALNAQELVAKFRKEDPDIQDQSGGTKKMEAARAFTSFWTHWFVVDDTSFRAQLSSMADPLLQCASGWTLSGSLCYGPLHAEGMATKEAAVEACRVQGGHLPYIKTAHENHIVQRLASLVSGYFEGATDRQLWLGLGRPDEAAEWTWDDGTPVTFNMWATAFLKPISFPDKTKAWMSTDGMWYIGNYRSDKPMYLCEANAIRAEEEEEEDVSSGKETMSSAVVLSLLGAVFHVVVNFN